MRIDDRFLLFACAVFAAGTFPVAPLAAVVGSVVAGLALLVFGRASARALLVALAGFAAAGLRAELAMADARATYERAREVVFPPAVCELEGVVVEPITLRQGVTGTIVEVRRGACEGRAWPTGDRLQLSGVPSDTLRGDALALRADVGLVQRFANSGASDKLARVARTGAATSGRVLAVERTERGASPAALVDRARGHVRARIEATYHPDAAALGRALVLGETDLDREVDEAFRGTGLSHLLAVSGTHLVIAVLASCAALRALLLRWAALAQRVDVGRVTAAAAAALSWVYADFAGGSGSVFRAAAMVTASSLANAMGRRPSPSRTFAASLLAGAAVDPLAALDVSFTLSAAATLGLMTLSRPIGRLLGGEAPEGAGAVRRARAWLASAVATTLGATLACAPVIACLSPSLPVAGVVANVVAAPLGEAFALPFALAHGVLGFSPSLERGAAFVASGSLRAVLAVARVAHAASVALPVPPPSGGQIACLVAGATAIFAARTIRGRVAVAALAVAVMVSLEGAARRAGRTDGTLRVSVLDVGQGDAILVDMPDGRLVMIDGGGMPASPFDVGERVVWPALRARRRDRVDVLVVSHPHPDHFGGLEALVGRVAIGELWDTGEAERDGRPPPGMARILGPLRARGVPVLGPEALCDREQRFGEAVLEVIAPCPHADETLSTNDASFVVRVSLGRRRVLLTGDLEREGEELVLARRGDDLAADVLKVGHHGSKTSSSEAFVDAVSPRWAAISSGVRNRFGHPHPRTLETLGARGIRVRRTDLGGEWRYETDGEREWVSW